MPKKQKTNKKTNNKKNQKKIFPSKEVVSFSDLAKKYQKKLDNLLGTESTIKEVDEVLEDYVEDVENLFVVDKDHDEHKIIKLKSSKKQSPYVLDLSRVQNSQAVDLAKAADLYKKFQKKKELLLANKKKLKQVKGIKANKIKEKKNQKHISKLPVKTADKKKPKKKENKKDLSKEIKAQKIEFSYWRYWWYRNLRFVKYYFKGLIFVLVLLFAMTVFVSNNLGYVNQALKHGEEAMFTLDQIQNDLVAKKWDKVENQLSVSTRQLLLAQGKLQQVNPLMDFAFQYIPYVNKKYNSIQKLLNGSVSLGLATSKLFYSIDENFIVKGELNLSNQISKFLEDLNLIQLFFLQAYNSFNDLDVKYFPKEYGDNIIEIQKILPRIIKVNSYLISYKRDILDLLGHDYERRYLFLFQNNKELRPAGGFLGSLALLDVAGGEISNIEVPGGGPYDYQGGLNKYLLAPKPLRILNSRWYLHDSNWFSDFPTSAEKILWFLEKSGGPSADGVVALNFSVLEDLLKIIGPIEMPDYDLTLTSKNVWIELQKEVELDYDKEANKPKAIIGDLLFQLEEQFQNSDAEFKQKVLQIVLANLWQKDIVLYSKNQNIQEILQEYKIAGNIVETEGDYFMLVNANVGGSKTDAVMEQKIDRQLLIKEDGSLVVTAEITRKHTGDEANLFTGKVNVNYMQLYVPQGSELLAAYGFTPPDKSKFKQGQDYYEEDKDLSKLYNNIKVDDFSETQIHNEFGKTVFSNYIVLDPGEEKTITVMYKLPFKLQDLKLENNYYKYNLYIQKQSGMKNTVINNSFVLPEKLNIEWSSPKNLQNKIHSLNLLSDEDFIMLLK